MSVDFRDPVRGGHGTGDRAVARAIGKHDAPHGNHFGQVETEPAQPSIVDAPELGLETLAKRDHRRIWSAGEQPSQGGVDGAHAKRMQPRGNIVVRQGESVERIVQALEQLNSARVVQVAGLRG